MINDLNFTTQSSFLHHGIQGQKWGVQNGPPYPLGSYISTGKRLRKAARKEAKALSKEYSNAKKAAKNYKENMKLSKNIYKDVTDKKVKKAYKAQYKDYKAKYKNAKEEMDKNKQNSQTAKEVLKSLENKSLSEVEQFLKDREYTTESITKLAMKDYKKEQKKASKEGRRVITENEKKANDEFLITINKIKDNYFERNGYAPVSSREEDFTKEELKEYAKASMKYANDLNLYGRKYTNLDDYLLDVTNQRGDKALYSLWGDLIEYI